MPDKPTQWSSKYASIFQDESVVAAYQHRPPYPPETFTFLSSLIPPTVARRTVLDAGCGTGFIARPFAPFVDQVDAVDISEEMIRMGQALPGGNRPNIRWVSASIETAHLNGPYALIVAAASLHWMDWERALPRFAVHLAPNCVLALVEERTQPNPWDASISPISGRYSMNTDFAPYDMTTVAAELEQRRLFQLQGCHETRPVSFQQSVAAWVESVHARNGFSRDRMDAAAAAACDAELRSAIRPYCRDDIVAQNIGARILWGAPLSGTPPSKETR
ncbi:MAG: class I SAM-dependent methyltransferase [Chloroflexi bacterium]|nr:MAG: class I SAM-dependent methyltransferase [Chloroflexota bacterium]